MARSVFYAESLADSTTTSSTFQDKTTLTWTPAASTDYWVFHTSLLESTSSSAINSCRLQDTTGATTFSYSSRENKDTTGTLHSMGMAKFTSGGSPGSTDFKTQFRTTSGTVTIRDSRITVFEADADDEWANSDTESSTTSNSYQDKTTLTFTPGSSGDYLIVAFAEITGSGATYSAFVKLLHDTASNDYGEVSKEPEDSGEYTSWGTMVKLTLGASSQTFKIQYRGEQPNVQTYYIQRARILAIRLDTLVNSYYAESRSRSTTTSTTLQDKATLTQTPQAEEHVILMCSLLDGSSTNTDMESDFVEGATSLMPENEEPNDTSDTYPRFLVYSKTLSASSTTWKTQYNSESSSATTGISESAIAVLQTGGSSTISLEGSSSASGTASGDLTVDHTLSGSATVAATISATLEAFKSIQGISTGTVTTSADILIERAIEGSATGSASASGSLSIERSLGGSVAASGTASGDLEIERGIGGSSTGSSSASGSLSVFKQLTGSSTGSGTASGQMTVNYLIQGSSSGSSSASGTLSVMGVALLEGTATGSISASGSLGATLVLTGVSTASSSTSADLSVVTIVPFDDSILKYLIVSNHVAALTANHFKHINSHHKKHLQNNHRAYLTV